MPRSRKTPRRSRSAQAGGPALSRKSKAQLIDEVERLRQRVAALEATAGGTVPSPAAELDVMGYVAEQLPFYLAWKDRDLVYLGCNWNQARAVGLSSPAEIAGKTDFDLPWSREEAELYRAGDRKVIETGEPMTDREATQHLADGTVMNIVTSKAPLRNDAGEIVGVISMFVDITERKQAEGALRDSEERLRQLIDGSIQGIIVTRGLEPIFANKSYSEMFGYDEPDEVMALEEEAPLVAPEDRARLQRYATAREAGRDAPEEYEFGGVRKDGSRIWLNNRVRTIDWLGGPAFLSTVTDITERKSAEDKLRAAHDELEKRVAERTGELSRLRQETEDAHERLADAIENIPDGFILFDADERLVLCNGRYRDLYPLVDDVLEPGATLEDITRAAFERGAVASSAHDVESWIAMRVEQHRAASGSHEQHLQDGRWVLASERRTHDGGRVGIRTEITERKRAEEALRESEERFRTIAEATPTPVFIARIEDGMFMYANRETGRILGLPPEEIVGRKTREFYDDPADRERYIAEIKKHGFVRDRELRIRRADGAVISTVNSIQTVDYEGEAAFLGGFYDITERKRMEERLRDKEQEAARMRQQLFDAIESIPDGFVLYDADERLVICNSKYREFYPTVADIMEPGASMEELTRAGAERGQFVVSNGQLDDWVAERLQQFRSGRGIYEQQFSDGRWLLASDRRTPEGATVGIRTDITERKRQEEDRRQAQKMEAVGQLTGGVAHDFNNLLTIILGNLELLNELVEDPSEIDAMVGPARSAARRGAELTQRLLAFSRKQTLRPTTIDLQQLISGMADLLQRTLGETIEIKAVTIEQPWRTVADAGQVENALLNLAINARDAMPNGGELIFETGNAVLDEDYAAAHADSNPGDFVTLSVTDTGIGMSEDVLSRAFEPFFTTKDIGEGTGLGLSMVYGFVRQSGGHTRIFSEPGKGTTVRLYLPRAKGADAAADEAGATRAAPTGSESILVVEDDDALRELAVRMLEGLGYGVASAPNGRLALALLENNPGVDLLLTDVVLPEGMSGRDVAEEVTRRRPGIKVLYMSGYADTVLAEHGKLSEQTALLKKPFMKRELAQALRSVLEQGGA